MSSRAAVVATQNQLLGWLRDVAIPVWDQHGVDRRSGGYFEELLFVEPQRVYAASGAVRRGRVVARQISVFAVATVLGWQPPRGIRLRTAAIICFRGCISVMDISIP